MVYWSNGGNFSINTCTLWKSNFFSSKLACMHRLQVESLFQWSDIFSSVCQGSNAFSVLHKKMVTLIAGAASIVYSKVDMNLIKNGQKWLTWTPGQAVYLLTMRSSFTPLLHKVLIYRKQGLASKHGATSTAWKTKGLSMRWTEMETVWGKRRTALSKCQQHMKKKPTKCCPFVARSVSETRSPCLNLHRTTWFSLTGEPKDKMNTHRLTRTNTNTTLVSTPQRPAVFLGAYGRIAGVKTKCVSSPLEVWVCVTLSLWESYYVVFHIGNWHFLPLLAISQAELWLSWNNTDPYLTLKWLCKVFTDSCTSVATHARTHVPAIPATFSRSTP